MSHTITKYDANILNHHAKSGDALELGRTLDTIAQREAPNGYDRADILLLAKDSQLPRQEWRRLGVSQNTRPTGPARGSEDPNDMDRADILFVAKGSEDPNGFDRADILLAKEEAGDNIVHSACAFGNTNELVSGITSSGLDFLIQTS
ncbi:ankyrin repeat domain protein [Diaporthe eres]|nr:ankyrin repeat domain protein [Diaporthe eres]